MNDRPGGWSRRDSDVETTRVITGHAWVEIARRRALPGPPSTRPRGITSNSSGIPRPRQPADDQNQQDRGSYNLRTRQPKARRGRLHRITRIVAVVVVLLLIASSGTYVWADSKLDRVVDLGKVADRPPHGKGTNYLIVGSDSRAGLSEQAKKELHAGSASGGRTDTMILLHTGAHGTSMLSLPRDSWVTIPPYVLPDTGKHYPQSKNKLNAAFSLGGPTLLVQTIERNTGLRIDHYVEVGLGGFVGIVNGIGGVRMCVDKNINDPKSGENLTKGCHLLNGSQALSFVRQRHQEANGDLGRIQNQQRFLATLAHKAATPGVMLNPLKVYPIMSAGLGTLVLDKSMRLWSLVPLFRATKSTIGSGKRIDIPVSNLDFRTDKGSAVTWKGPQSRKLFAELRNDQPVQRH